MRTKIMIQDEISITQSEVDNCIKKYKKMPLKYSMGIPSWWGNRDEIIEQIEKLTEVGKAILLMNHKFNEWKKSDEYKRMEKEAKNKK